MNGFFTEMANVLRAAGCQVVEYDGWKTRGHYGGFSNLDYVVWHHDASPPGDSPGVPRYMLGAWNSHGAQLWVSRTGVWHVIAAGPAYHAGAVRAGKPGNRNSLGVETDHTTGEAWPPALLASLRRGTKALFDYLKTDASHLEFHKTVCDPPGRKTDPDGLDLATERLLVSKGAVNPLYKLGDRMLGFGDVGKDVGDLQRLLQLRYSEVVVDEDFGRVTESAVVKFQTFKKLDADGVVGPATLAELRKVDPFDNLVGLIKEKYNGLTPELKLKFGVPTTPETPCGPDGKGRFNHFVGGSIYWHPDLPYGAQPVYGAIRDGWETQNWETGYLGYPMTPEFQPESDKPGLRRQDFQGGILEWTEENGVWVRRRIL